MLSYRVRADTARIVRSNRIVHERSRSPRGSDALRHRPRHVSCTAVRHAPPSGIGSACLKPGGGRVIPNARAGRGYALKGGRF